MRDAFGVEREDVSKGALKTILFGAQKAKKPPSPPKISLLTGEEIKFNPKIPTKPQKAFWGRNVLTGQRAPKRYAGYQAKRRERLAQNTQMFPKAKQTGEPRPWYRKRSNQAMMAGGVAAFGGAGYMGYRKGSREPVS